MIGFADHVVVDGVRRLAGPWAAMSVKCRVGANVGLNTTYEAWGC